MRRDAGQSLIQVIIGVGIMGILMMSFLSMLATQQKESRALSEKFASLSLKSLLSSVLADGSVCYFELNNPAVLRFDSSNPATLASQSISVNQIHASANVGAESVAKANSLAAPDSSTLMIAPSTATPPGIQLTGFAQSSPTVFTANWTINFTGTVRSLRPIKIPVRLTVAGAGTASTTITACQAGTNFGQRLNVNGPPPGGMIRWYGNVICMRASTTTGVGGFWSGSSWYGWSGDRPYNYNGWLGLHPYSSYTCDQGVIWFF